MSVRDIGIVDADTSASAFLCALRFVFFFLNSGWTQNNISAQFSMSDSLWPHGSQYARPPSPSPVPRACSNSYPLSQWCHPTIWSSVVPFSYYFQSFSAPGSFSMSWHFTSGGQSIGASVSASVLPMNIQDWIPLGLTGLISLLSTGL